MDLVNETFDTDLSGWTTDWGTWFNVGDPAPGSLYLASLKTTLGPIDRGVYAFHDFSVAADAINQPIDFYAKLCEFTGPAERPLRVRLYDTDLITVLEDISIPASEIPDYPFWVNYLLFSYTFTVAGTYRMRFSVANRINLGADEYGVDSVFAEYLDAGDVMARSTLSTFLTKLKTQIEAIDDQIGKVFTSKRRWRTTTSLQDDGVIIQIDDAGLIDDVDQLGTKALRFWFCDPRTTISHLSNVSMEYRHVVELIGFYQRGVDDEQEVALRKAATEILDDLTLKDTELQVLSTGAGYEGYLEEVPTMLTSIVDAKLGESGIVGHSVRLQVVFHEEISREV